MNSSLIENIYFDEAKKNKAGSIKFVFNVVGSIPIAAFIWLFGLVFTIPFVISYGRLLNENIDNEILIKESEVAIEVKEQVEHDIYAPIQSILGVAQSSESIDEFEKECLLSAIDRIEEIVQDLSSNKPKKCLKTVSPINLSNLINSIIAEKIMSKNIRIESKFTEKTFGAFSSVSEGEFKRVLSNLIDNATNAIRDTEMLNMPQANEGKIIVNLDVKDKFLKLEIADNGVGISKDILNEIGKRGMSFRSGGSGLGLSYAISKVKEWDGDLKINSKEGKGTDVLITLPLQSTHNYNQIVT